LAISNIWKNVGWNAIIYLAAIATINPELYEAADMDGATRFQKMRYVTLPAIRSTFILLFVLSLGNILSAGFDQPYLLMNPTVREWAVNLDIYVFTEGLRSFGAKPNFSYGTAAGIFKTVVSFILILGANQYLKRGGKKGLF
jgi:putative aldouronate transport system permease protein